MFNSRQELYDRAKKTYISLFERLAKRYSDDYQYVISDHVGYSVTKIEDFFRPLWGIAPFLKDGGFDIDFDGKKISVVDFINKFMKEGTSENSPRRFDKDVTEETKIGFANQAVTEIAAYLLAVLFAKEELWDKLSDSERDTIGGYIKKWSVIAIKDSWQNNHYWYPIFCLEILKKLGYDCSECQSEIDAGYAFLETLYYNHGWYSDGAVGRFDYYEAWAHHTYTLLWILIADKNSPDYERRAELYRKRSSEYLKYFAHYFDADGGMVAYGRSIGYRFAATAPFALAVMTGCDIDAGLCKNIILKNTSYFYEKSIETADGCFPVGYLYESSGFGENYASDGAISCYTEGFLCLLADDNSPLWQAEITPLPIECADYRLPSPLSDLQTVLEGNSKNGITLYNNALHYYQDAFFTHRFNDMASAYSKFAYNSRSGFALSSRDLVSCDNMISLSTADGTMESHRKRILNNTVDGDVMISEHIPFSNDEGTVIKTYMLPLCEGYHARVHKVTLKNPYIVMEGGFSIGLLCDNYISEESRISYGDYRSSIRVFCKEKITYTPKKSHPGMHLLAPQSIYPAYQTEVLAPGEYLFCSIVYFSADGKWTKEPEVLVGDGEVRITMSGAEKTIKL